MKSGDTVPLSMQHLKNATMNKCMKEKREFKAGNFISLSLGNTFIRYEQDFFIQIKNCSWKVKSV